MKLGVLTTLHLFRSVAKFAADANLKIGAGAAGERWRRKTSVHHSPRWV